MMAGSLGTGLGAASAPMSPVMVRLTPLFIVGLLVPEPSSLVLAGTGLCALALLILLQRRHRAVHLGS